MVGPKRCAGAWLVHGRASRAALAPPPSPRGESAVQSLWGPLVDFGEEKARVCRAKVKKEDVAEERIRGFWRSDLR